MRAAKQRNLAHITRDRGYRFVDRDPILEEVTRLITDSGRSTAWIAEQSGVTSATINSWCMGNTRRPQNLTVDAVLLALGFRRRLEKSRS